MSWACAPQPYAQEEPLGGSGGGITPAETGVPGGGARNVRKNCGPRKQSGAGIPERLRFADPSRAKLLALVCHSRRSARGCAKPGLTDVPRRSPGRGPPYWKSSVLRRQALGDENQCGDHSSKGDETA